MRKLAIFNIHEKQHLILGDIVVDEGGHILVRGGRHVGSGGVEESKVTQITAAAACYAHTERLTQCLTQTAFWVPLWDPRDPNFLGNIRS